MISRGIRGWEELRFLWDLSDFITLVQLVPPGGICIVYLGIVWNSTKSYEQPWIGMSRGESTVRFTPLVDIEKDASDFGGSSPSSGFGAVDPGAVHHHESPCRCWKILLGSTRWLGWSQGNKRHLS